ncbi:MAG: peptide deformylase [bacterium]
MNAKKLKYGLITLPNINLRSKSMKVGIITDETIEIVESMKKVLLQWESEREHEVGVALASIQIDVPYKIVIIRKDLDDKDNHDFDVFINPSITKYEGELVEDFEGCLSIKDIYGKVPRFSKVRIKATDLDGKPIRHTAKGFIARVFQHEIDHTDGKLFIDHIKNENEAFFKLMPDGKLKQLDYEKDVEKNSILW